MPNWNQKTKTHKIKFPFCQGQTKTPGGFYTWPPIHGIICLFVPDFPTAMVEILEVRVPSPRDQVSRYLPKWKGHHRIDPCLTLGNLRFFSKKKMRGCYCIYISWWDGNTRYTNISYISCIYISIIYKSFFFFGGGGATISIHKLFMDSSNQNPGWTEFQPLLTYRFAQHVVFTMKGIK